MSKAIVMSKEDVEQLEAKGRFVSNESRFIEGAYNLVIRNKEDIENLIEICESNGVNFVKYEIEELLKSETMYLEVVHIEDSVLHFGIQKYTEIIEMEDMWDSILVPNNTTDLAYVNKLEEILLKLEKAQTAIDVNLDGFFCFGPDVDGLKEELFAHYRDASNMAFISRDYHTEALKLLNDLLLKIDEDRANEN